MRLRIVIALSVLVVFLALRLMSRPLAGLHREIHQAEQQIRELEERKRQIRALQVYLEKIRGSTGARQIQILYEEDTTLLRAGLVTLLEGLLRDLGLQGQVVVGEVSPSGDFPAFLHVSEVQVEVGVGFYKNYLQLLSLMAALQNLPLTVELFCYGECEEIAASGNPRLRLKFYMVQR